MIYNKTLAGLAIGCVLSSPAGRALASCGALLRRANTLDDCAAQGMDVYSQALSAEQTSSRWGFHGAGPSQRSQSRPSGRLPGSPS